MQLRRAWLTLLALVLSASVLRAQKSIAYVDGMATPIIGESGVLAKLSANMNTTADQTFAITATKYVVRRITVTNASTSLTLAVGGLYTAASKGGTPIVAATQIYSGLTGATKFLDLALAAILTTDVRSESTLYFALTTAQGATATADVYLIGDVLP